MTAPIARKTCKECGKRLAPQQQEFCSPVCLSNFRSLDKSPEVWDGKTEYSQRPLRHRYQAKCLQAGHVQGEAWLTMLELRAMRPLPPCSVCRGHVALEPTDVGGMGSPFATRPRMSTRQADASLVA